MDVFKIPLPYLAYGGSLSLESLPLLLVALRRGSRAGLVAGTVYGVVSFLIKPIVVHPVQLLLDYPAAYGMLGWTCGLAARRGTLWSSGPPLRARVRVVLGILAGSSVRLGVHFVSGVVFFSAYAPPGQPVWAYSLIYNSSYIMPQALIYILLSQLIIRFLTLRER